MASRFASARALAAATVVVLLSACTDSNPVGPPPPGAPPAPAQLIASLLCTADVAAGRLACIDNTPAAQTAARAYKILGGQDVYVKLASSGVAYSSGTGIFSASVTVQNLVDRALGTTDGTTVSASGVRVFFHSGPSVTGGSGTVDVANEDGVMVGTGTDQPYFQYSQIVQPYEISSGRSWQFQLSSGVTSFSFVVYVWAQLADEVAPLRSHVWTGAVSSDWATAGNWSGNAVPGATSAAHVPSSALYTGSAPALTAHAEVQHLRVGAGNTLAQGGFRVQVNGNLDIETTSSLTSGTVRMAGTGGRLRGTLNALEVTGSTVLQGSTKATGAVNVTGSLTLNGNAFTISVP